MGDYYVGQDGTLVADTMVDGYYVDENGKRRVVHFEDGDPKEETPQYIFVGDSRTVGMKKYGGGKPRLYRKSRRKDTNGFYKRDKDFEKALKSGSAVQGHY